MLPAMRSIGFFGLSSAFPSLRDHIPNGRRVPCPTGAEGCSAGDAWECQPHSVCNGVGHQTCEGGSLPLNAFGAALMAAEFRWSDGLCNADSDGDGLTNGEELGDPCCLWGEGDEPSAYMRAHSPTHPGFADASEVVDGYVRPDCDATAPARQGVALNAFNDGEEVRSVEVFIRDFEIPADKTTYVDIALNFPLGTIDAGDVFHAVYAEAIVSQARFLHHYVVYGCSERFPDELDGRPVTRGDPGFSSCQSGIFGGWAPGSDVITTVPWAGRPVGPGVGIVALRVNVHYDNQGEESGVIDNSGIRVWYTPDLRPHNLTELPFLMVSNNPVIVVPPGAQRWFMTRSCLLDVRDRQTGEEAEMHVAAISYHAHLLGREMYAELFPVDGTEPIDLASEKIWHFDDQGWRNIVGWNITLRTGDFVQATCVMDSTSRTEGTRFGRETTDEMCWASVGGWSSTSNGVSVACSGEIWTGELAAGEPAFGIREQHPVEAADTVLDGTNVFLGGNILRLNGREPASGCTNQLPACSMIIAAGASMGLGCDANVSQVGERMRSQVRARLGDGLRAFGNVTLLNMCCAAVCTSICPEHERCLRAGHSATSTTSTTTTTWRAGPWEPPRVRSMVCPSYGQSVGPNFGDDPEEMGAGRAARIPWSGLLAVLLPLAAVA